MDVYSEPGHGATFRIYLPSAEKPVAEPVPTSQKSGPRRVGTILLVEDQAAIRMFVEDVLSGAGHHVLAAGSGPAALRLVEKYPNHIDLLITDVVMPGMSGPELAAQLTRLRPNSAVLYISGYSDHALLHRGVIEKGVSFLQKPFLPETLVIRVDELFESALRGQAVAEP